MGSALIRYDNIFQSEITDQENVSTIEHRMMSSLKHHVVHLQIEFTAGMRENYL